jgi:MFS family permease
MALPFLTVVGLSLAAAAGFVWFEFPASSAGREPVPLGLVLRTRTIAACAVAVIGVSATVSMLEPVLALQLQTFGVGPARIGLIFGIGAVASTLLNPVFGRAADRWGARRLMTFGLVATACALALLGQTWSYGSTVVLMPLTAAAAALIITPSLSYMGEATSQAGFASFGVAYGIYNMAWGVGLLGGPAVGGFLFERVGFSRFALLWAPLLALLAVVLGTAAAAPRRAIGGEPEPFSRAPASRSDPIQHP